MNSLDTLKIAGVNFEEFYLKGTSQAFSVKIENVERFLRTLKLLNKTLILARVEARRLLVFFRFIPVAWHSYLRCFMYLTTQLQRSQAFAFIGISILSYFELCLWMNAGVISNSATFVLFLFPYALVKAAHFIKELWNAISNGNGLLNFVSLLSSPSLWGVICSIVSMYALGSAKLLFVFFASLRGENRMEVSANLVGRFVAYVLAARVCIDIIRSIDASVRRFLSFSNTSLAIDEAKASDIRMEEFLNLLLTKTDDSARALGTALVSNRVGVWVTNDILRALLDIKVAHEELSVGLNDSCKMRIDAEQSETDKSKKSAFVRSADILFTLLNVLRETVNELQKDIKIEEAKDLKVAPL